MKLLLSAVLSIVLVGCGGDEDPAPKAGDAPAPAAPVADIVQPAQTEPVLPPPPGSAPAATGAATPAPQEQEIPSKDALEAVTMAVQSYFIRFDRAPASLDELVNSGYLKKLPAPPAGKKYVYDPESASLKLENL